MAEDRITPKHETDELSRDDVKALGYVLQHVRGAGASSMSPLLLSEAGELGD